jgi:hypothetical protein
LGHFSSAYLYAAASIALILAGPSFMGSRAFFPLEDPGLVSIPVGFLATALNRMPGSAFFHNSPHPSHSFLQRLAAILSEFPCTPVLSSPLRSDNA